MRMCATAITKTADGVSAHAVLASGHVNRTRIKVCGMTHPDDARAAATAGADAIGIVFHPPSKRNISLGTARKILDALPAFVTPVGLFVDAEPDAILQVTRELHLRHVQLHGHEAPHDVAALKGLVIIKAIRVDPAHFSKTLKTWRDAMASPDNLPHLRGIVLETATKDDRRRHGRRERLGRRDRASGKW